MVSNAHALGAEIDAELTDEAWPEPSIRPLPPPLDDDGARALAILAELSEAGLPFEVRRAVPLRHDSGQEWEWYANVYVDGERQKTGRHRSMLACLAAVVEMWRAGR